MPNLEVQLGAKLDDFERGLDQAVSMADSAVGKIEGAFSNLNPGFDGLSTVFAGMLTSIPAILAFAKSMNSELAAMERQARELGLTLEGFQGVQFAGAQKGIGSAEFVAGLEKSVGLLNDAQRNTNTLSELFAANSLQLTESNGKLISTNELLRRSADLIARAASEQDKIKIAQMLGLTREWIPLLESGAQAFDRQAQEAARLGVVIDRETIEKAAEFDRKWTASSAAWSANIKAAAAEILPVINELIDAASKMFTRENLKLFSQGGLDALGELGVPRELNIKIPDSVLTFLDNLRRDLDRDYNIKINFEGRPPPLTANEVTDGTGASPGADQARTRLRVDGPASVVPPRRSPAGSEGRDPFESTVDSTNRRIAVLNAETATIGQNSEARERARTVAILEEAAKRANTAAGLENTAATAEQREQIEALATAMETAAKNHRLMADAMASFRELGSAASEAFKGLTLEGKKFDEVLSNLLNRLASRGIDMAFNGLFNSLGGSLGSLFGGGGGTSTFGFNPIAGAFNFGGGRANGGPVNPDQIYRVGERGEEWFVPNSAGRIVPNDVVRGAAGGVSAPVSISIDARGADPAAIARLHGALAQLESELPHRVVTAVQEAQSERRL